MFFNKLSAVLAALFLFLTPIQALPQYKADSDDGYLLLVNANNPLPDGYGEKIESGLYEVHHTRNDGRPVQRLLRPAAEALDMMLDALNESGCGVDDGACVSVTSGYRARDYQSLLYENRVALLKKNGLDTESARKKAASSVAAPGTSEHETGLCADLHCCVSAQASFSKTKQYAWLSLHAHEYGFILRYPEGKESITGVCFEPWHYRYVGKKAASYIYESGLCFEEFILIINKT